MNIIRHVILSFIFRVFFVNGVPRKLKGQRLNTLLVVTS